MYWLPAKCFTFIFLLSVKPFVTAVELKETERIVAKFESGIGKDLQRKLEEKAKNSKNWVSVWIVD